MRICDAFIKVKFVVLESRIIMLETLFIWIFRKIFFSNIFRENKEWFQVILCENISQILPVVF